MSFLQEVLLPDREAAVAALGRVGGVYQPRLDLQVSHPVAGEIKRYFAVLGNAVVDGSGWADGCIADALRVELSDPDNSRLYDKLADRRLGYTPVNKRTVERVARRLDGSPLHLPWSYKMRNFDLGLALSRVHRLEPYAFEAFYSHHVSFNQSDDGVSITLDRLFSLPVVGDLSGTWQGMLHDGMLDEEVALILEVNTR